MTRHNVDFNNIDIYAAWFWALNLLWNK